MRRLVQVALAGSILLASTALAVSGLRLRVEPREVPVGGLAIVRFVGVAAGGSAGEVPLRFFRSGEESVALVGIDLDSPSGPLPVVVRDTAGGYFEASLEVREKKFPEERLRVLKKYVEPGDEVLERIIRDKQLLDSLWLRSDDERHWRGAFERPAKGRPGSPFGLRRFFNDQPRSPHGGIDIKAPIGTPVFASNRGRVALVDDLYFTGKTVVLDHGLGLFTIYIHLSAAEVTDAAIVDKGSRIGRVGATGRVTGPHLHFAMRMGEARIDPETVFGRGLGE